MARQKSSHDAPVQQPEPLVTGWKAASARLQGLPGGGLSIAHEAPDRHVASGHGNQTALIWLGRDGQRDVLTCGDLTTTVRAVRYLARAMAG